MCGAVPRGPAEGRRAAGAASGGAAGLPGGEDAGGGEAEHPEALLPPRLRGQEGLPGQGRLRSVSSAAEEPWPWRGDWRRRRR